MNQVLFSKQESVEGIGEIMSNGFHPFAVRLRSDPSDINPASCKLNHKKNMVSNQTAEAPNLNREEVGCRKSAPMNSKKVGQVVFLLLSGAGSRPCSTRILATEVRATSCPRLLIAPTIRVYPHLGFCRAMRMTSSRMSF